MSTRVLALTVGLTLVVSGGAGPISVLALSGDEVGVLANRNSSASLKVARHYLSMRGIPADNLIQLDLPQDETISRRRYEEDVLRPVRSALVKRKLTSKIRVLVTTYDLPLRIAPQTPSSAEERWLKDAAERQRFAEAHLERAIELLSQIAAPTDSDADPKPSEGREQTGTTDSNALMTRLNRSTQAAIGRLKEVNDSKRRDKWSGDLARIMKLVGGAAALVQYMAPSPTVDQAKAQAELAQLKQQITWSQHAIHTLMAVPTNETRERAYKLSERIFGLLGVLRFAIEETAAYSQKDSDASLDSELSLLWWDSDFYRLSGRLGNPLYYGTRSRVRESGPSVPVLMISRLDAPSPDLAMKLVDQAIAAERTGPQGKVYVDSRGMKPQPGDMYGVYDQSLRDLASLIKTRTSYEVIHDDTERRFSHPGDAPDTVLYAGWYILRSYEDAFTFRPGAIGYHIASAEAVSLHDPAEPGWCKNALEKGIAATLGSTGEPYLDSFPLPQEFFGLLLTGRFNLVESYYITTRYTSWRMVLIGDPLYNPWKEKKQLSQSAVTFPAGPDGQITPLPPSEQPFPEPVEAARAFRQQRQTALAEVDRILIEAEKELQLRKAK